MGKNIPIFDADAITKAFASPVARAFTEDTAPRSIVVSIDPPFGSITEWNYVFSSHRIISHNVIDALVLDVGSFMATSPRDAAEALHSRIQTLQETPALSQLPIMVVVEGDAITLKAIEKFFRDAQMPLSFYMASRKGGGYQMTRQSYNMCVRHLKDVIATGNFKILEGVGSTQPGILDAFQDALLQFDGKLPMKDGSDHVVALGVAVHAVSEIYKSVLSV